MQRLSKNMTHFKYILCNHHVNVIHLAKHAKIIKINEKCPSALEQIKTKQSKYSV